MLLKDVWIDAPHRHRSLTLFRLMDPEGRTLPYRLVSEALEAGTLEIEEVNDRGSVPELLARNAGERDVLVLDGQQLLGAKQNRMTNRSLLLPAMTDTRIPVSCIEQGRWHRRERGFRDAPDHAPPTLRLRVREAEARSAEGPAGAQGQVWDSVASFSRRTGIRSDTGALDQLFEGRRDELEQGARGFPLRAGQVGTLAAVDDRVVAMDLVGCVELYARLHRGLVRGYLFEALAEEGRSAEVGPGGGPRRRASGDDSESGKDAGPREDGRAWPDKDLARAFLERTAAAKRVETPSVGRGTYRVLSGPVLGGELRDGKADGGDGERLVHLSGFPESA